MNDICLEWCGCGDLERFNCKLVKLCKKGDKVTCIADYDYTTWYATEVLNIRKAYVVKGKTYTIKEVKGCDVHLEGIIGCNRPWRFIPK